MSRHMSNILDDEYTTFIKACKDFIDNDITTSDITTSDITDYNTLTANKLTISDDYYFKPISSYVDMMNTYNDEFLSDEEDDSLCEEIEDTDSTVALDERNSYIVYKESLPDMSKITENVFVGNWSSSKDMDLLNENGITSIICIETKRKSKNMIRDYKINNIEHHFFCCFDDETYDISMYFDETYNIIKSCVDNKTNVLIHCWAGISRSVTLLINYLLREEETKVYTDIITGQMLLDNIITYIRSIRPYVNPNAGFIRKLIHVADTIVNSKNKLEDVIF